MVKNARDQGPGRNNQGYSSLLKATTTPLRLKPSMSAEDILSFRHKQTGNETMATTTPTSDISFNKFAWLIKILKGVAD